MSQLLEYDGIKKSDYLLISYSHKDKTIVHQCAEELITSGARVWYDARLKAGDEWKSIVEDLLCDNKCKGAILFLSENALLKDNVLLEWKIIADLLEKSKSNGEKIFNVFLVSIGNLSYSEIMRQAFSACSEEDVEKNLPVDTIRTFVRLIGNDRIWCGADVDSIKNVLLPSIVEKIPLVVDESDIVRKELIRKSEQNSFGVFSLGHYNENGNSKSLSWHFLKIDSGSAICISEKSICKMNGGTKLFDWLNGAFFEESFSPEEKNLTFDGIRLLSMSEVGDMPRDILSIGEEWWLSDCHGALQSVIREDGTVYRNGFNNKLCQRGVRPIIKVDLKWLREYSKECNE